MLKKIDHNKMGRSSYEDMHSLFHFSFDHYYNPKNMNFGVLRVVNDDLIPSKAGFDLHPHRNMEIITYVINGILTHGDSMGNRRKIKRGHIQYMSAGTGIYHSEENLDDEDLRLLQIWIYPDKNDYIPSYGDMEYQWDLRENKWLEIVSSKTGNSDILINQDVSINVTELDDEKEIEFSVNKGRQAYLIQIEGKSNVNGYFLDTQDAMEIVEENILIRSVNGKSHIMILEMEKK